MTINKKTRTTFFLFFVLIILFLAGYLTYDYLEYKKEIEDYSYEIPKIVEYESVDNYEIIEAEEGKKIVNENAGLSFVVPSDWNVEKIEEEGTIEVSRFKRENNLNLEIIDSNCLFWIGVNNYLNEESRPYYLLKQIRGEEKLSSNREEVIIFSKYSALKTLRKSDKKLSINIEIPNMNKIYNFVLISSLNNEDYCIEQFNKILNTIFINI